CGDRREHDDRKRPGQDTRGCAGAHLPARWLHAGRAGIHRQSVSLREYLGGASVLEGRWYPGRMRRALALGSSLGERLHQATCIGLPIATVAPVGEGLERGDRLRSATET